MGGLRGYSVVGNASKTYLEVRNRLGSKPCWLTRRPITRSEMPKALAIGLTTLPEAFGLLLRRAAKIPSLAP